MLRAMIRGTKGIVATHPYAKGDVVHRLAGRVSSFPTKHAVAIADKMYIEDPRIIDMRASSEPSTVMLNGTIYAKTTIHTGEEITLPRSRFACVVEDASNMAAISCRNIKSNKM